MSEKPDTFAPTRLLIANLIAVTILLLPVLACVALVKYLMS